jgi:hypothetical protein
MAFRSMLHISDCDIQKNLYDTNMFKVLGFQESSMIEAKNKHPIELTE